MSSFWPKVRRKAGSALLLASLCLLPTPGRAGPYADLDARLGARTDAAAVAALERIAGDDADARTAAAGGPRAARTYIIASLFPVHGR